ncbi:hypothetical protein A8W25_03300 [Streptomyces sp. ERV7]|uniref:hypothetical protein n=1 Tax=Streptomyces sp. ERV7 TaxID=1322334 RepID=UPI0007F385C9|nr:hypothetical protein [Streptomyces sp. ERV7]OAR27297.1 hypothetical protein A8W25_03300 [Streptomyces sp. ERV7]
MGRHSLPDEHATEGTRGRPAVARRRTVALATLLVLVVAGGAAIAASSGLLSFGDSCRDSAVRLDLVASPDVAPAVRSVAERARADKVTSDGSCIKLRERGRELAPRPLSPGPPLTPYHRRQRCPHCPRTNVSPK